jgi:hypothetical protein
MYVSKINSTKRQEDDVLEKWEKKN